MCIQESLIANVLQSQICLVISQPAIHNSAVLHTTSQSLPILDIVNQFLLPIELLVNVVFLRFILNIVELPCAG